CHRNPCHPETEMKQRITILGAGESGTGAAILAKAKGHNVFVSDNGRISDKFKEELQAHAIAFEEGGHSTDKVLDCELVIKSPGISDQAPVVVAARNAGVEVIDEIEFAFRYIQGSAIAITGTNGKTTTTLLTY